MEVVPGILQHHVDLGSRDLFLYSVHGDRRHLLIDTGLASSPELAIEPDLRRHGLRLADVDTVILTHADADHIGGNEAVAETAAHARFYCHEQDRALVEHPDALLYDRYDQFRRDHGIAYEPEVMDALRGMLPDRLPAVHLGLTGGETVPYGPDRALSVLHTPGHTQGHVSLYDAAGKLAFIGDSVLRHGTVACTGELIAPPTYLNVDAYLGSIRLLRSLPLDYMCTCHFGVLKGSGIARFLDDSDQFVARFEQVLLGILAHSSAVWTMKALLAELTPVYPEYAFPVDFAYPVYAHMNKLAEQGIYAVTETDQGTGWIINDGPGAPFAGAKTTR